MGFPKNCTNFKKDWTALVLLEMILNIEKICYDVIIYELLSPSKQTFVSRIFFFLGIHCNIMLVIAGMEHTKTRTSKTSEEVSLSMYVYENKK